MKVIGIGCFWFSDESTDGNTDRFSIQTYLKNLQTTLDSVDNISNLRIEGIDGLTFPPSMLSDSYDSEPSQSFFPIFSRGSIVFDVFIPSRIQERHAFELSIGHGIENFHVEIRFGYDLPVTYISFDIPDNFDDWRTLSPSFAVGFVREHLKGKLSAGKLIKFECLGPSPLHCDAFLRSSDTISEIISRDITEDGEGYRRLYVEVNAETDDDAMDIFVEAFNDVLSSYYAVVVYRNDLLLLRSIVIDLTKDLFDRREKGIFKGIRRNIRIGTTIDSVFEAVLDEGLCRIDLADHIRKSSISDGNIFNQFIQRESEDVSQIPSDDIKQILRLLEDRRQQYFGHFATLVSGLVGGIIGAAIGAGISFALTHYSAASDQPPKNNTTSVVQLNHHTGTNQQTNYSNGQLKPLLKAAQPAKKLKAAE